MAKKLRYDQVEGLPNPATLIPYTGANQHANLGTYSITTNGIKVGHVTGSYVGFSSATPFSKILKQSSLETSKQLKLKPIEIL